MVSHSRSAALYARARRVLPDGTSRNTLQLDPHPIYVRSGRGASVVDADGNELLDFLGNYSTLIHGHSHPAVVAAVQDQLARGSSFSFASEPEIELAELLCERVPSFDRIRFMNSGTEAVMTAIKAARAYTGRSKIAKCEGAYHGTYDFAEVSQETGPSRWNEPAPPSVANARGTPRGVLEEVVVIPFNDAAAAERILTAEAENLAGILFDPVSLRVGLIPPRDDFVEMLVRVARRHRMLLILDEVVSFRMGYSGHQGILGIEPDLTVLGKVIGGGFAVGAVAGTASAMAVFEASGGKPPLPHSGTFNANPVAMAAGRATMELLTPAAYEHLAALGERTRTLVSEAFAETGVPGQVTGEGSLFRIHLHDRRLNGYRNAALSPEERARMAQFHRDLLEAGLFVAPNGFGCLATIMDDNHVERLAEAVRDGLRRLSPGRG